MGQGAAGEVVEAIGTVGLLTSAFLITAIGSYLYAPRLSGAVLTHSTLPRLW